MGQIIRLSAAPTVYPTACRDLNTGECVALLAFRWWVAAFRRNEDPMPRLRVGLREAGAVDAAVSMNGLMVIVTLSGRRSMTIHQPRHPALAPDETHLLHAAAFSQRGDRSQAEKALRTALLSAQEAELAMGPLEDIARLFAQARLLFRRRLPPPLMSID